MALPQNDEILKMALADLAAHAQDDAYWRSAAESLRMFECVTSGPVTCIEVSGGTTDKEDVQGVTVIPLSFWSIQFEKRGLGRK